MTAYLKLAAAGVSAIALAACTPVHWMRGSATWPSISKIGSWARINTLVFALRQHACEVLLRRRVRSGIQCRADA